MVSIHFIQKYNGLSDMRTRFELRQLEPVVSGKLSIKEVYHDSDIFHQKKDIQSSGFFRAHEVFVLNPLCLRWPIGPFIARGLAMLQGAWRNSSARSPGASTKKSSQMT